MEKRTVHPSLFPRSYPEPHGSFLPLGNTSPGVVCFPQVGPCRESLESPKGPGRSNEMNNLIGLVSVCCNRARYCIKLSLSGSCSNMGEYSFYLIMTPSADGCSAGRLWKNKAKVMKALRNPLRRRETISTVQQHPSGTFRRSYSFPESSLQSFRPSYEGASFSLGRPEEEHF